MLPAFVGEHAEDLGPVLRSITHQSGLVEVNLSGSGLHETKVFELLLTSLKVIILVQHMPVFLFLMLCASASTAAFISACNDKLNQLSLCVPLSMNSQIFFTRATGWLDCSNTLSLLLFAVVEESRKNGQLPLSFL